ncbi:MAG: helix-turn-helix protein, partial [Mucilaginibacter sp.]|nr:helix-turn-helix protein [Mucilaginibacter sp.]
MVIDRPALVFSSPSVPSSWETGPGPQSGWFCLFTHVFIESHEHKSALQDFPLFKVGGSHIIFPDEAQLTFLTGILGRMMEEMDSDYAGKYDLLCNYLRIIMHEALKITPGNTVETNTSAAARITAQFFELLERQFPIDSPEQFLKLKTANEF